MDVSMTVGPLHKELKVFGDRFWDQVLGEVRVTDPQAFVRMPITYERAFGGVDQRSDNPAKHGWERRNPVGTGFVADPNKAAGERLPNIENPRALIRSWSDRPGPAGFGPIAGHWSPRVELAGTYDDRWRNERLPLVPEDFDERFYLCAPQDQQVTEHLEGGERVVLRNLTAQGVLSFVLPKVSLGFMTYFHGRPGFDHTAILNTVVLEPDERRVMVVWETQLPCHNYGLKLQRTAIFEGDAVRPCANC
jgi:hypothetical protein